MYKSESTCSFQLLLVRNLYQLPLSACFHKLSAMHIHFLFGSLRSTVHACDQRKLHADGAYLGGSSAPNMRYFILCKQKSLKSSSPKFTHRQSCSLQQSQSCARPNLFHSWLLLSQLGESKTTSTNVLLSPTNHQALSWCIQMALNGSNHDNKLHLYSTNHLVF